MAKATILIEDVEDGEINVKTNFDPPLVAGDYPTGAQALGIDVVKGINDTANEDE